MCGEIYEQLFVYRALSLGYPVSLPVKPESYDAVIETGGNFLKIQIKSAKWTKQNGTYSVMVSKGSGTEKKAYTKEEVDFFAVYLIGVDTWFIIPWWCIKERKKISINPMSKNSRYTEYYENWELFNRGLSC